MRIVCSGMALRNSSLVFGLLLGLTGCGEDAGVLGFEPASFELGDALAGTAQGPVVLTYSGPSSITLSEVVVPPEIDVYVGPQLAAGGLSVGRALDPGERLLLQLILTRAAPGDYAATLIVRAGALEASLPIRAHLVEPVVEVAPAELDFGAVPLGERRELSVSLHNSTTVPVSLLGTRGDVSTAGVFTPRFQVSKVIDAGQTFTFPVEFSPRAAGEVSGPVTLHFDGFEVSFGARGVGVGTSTVAPRFEPDRVDFGAGRVGGTVHRSVTLSNPTDQTVVVRTVTLESVAQPPGPNDVFYVDTPLPIEVAAGAARAVDLVFAPALPGNHSDALYFALEAGALRLPVTGAGVALGELACAPSTVDFGAIPSDGEALANVDCTAQGGDVELASVETSSSSAFVLTMVGPSGHVSGGGVVSVGVRFLPRGVAGVRSGELVAHYTGQSGPRDVRVLLRGEAVTPSPPRIGVGLTWNLNDTDMDLHFVREGAPPFDLAGGDCYYASRAPDWGVWGDHSDDPLLELDDVDGFGPERARYDLAVAGVYTIYVHYYTAHMHGQATATVEVALAGASPVSVSASLACDELWTAGWISWDGLQGTFTATTTVVPPGQNNGICP